MNFTIFKYEFYFCTTQFALSPLVGHNHSYHYSTMRLKEYCWYFIWLWFQVEIFKKA